MRKAFTLIEVMVVLSILAIVAILAYNFFGSTMKEATLTAAVTQMENALNAVSDCHEKYYAKHGKWPGHHQINVLVADGCLKTKPKYPDSAWGGTDYATFSFNPFPVNSGNAHGPAGGEYYFVVPELSDDFCIAWNERQNGNSSATMAWMDVVPKGCDGSTGANRRRIMWKLYEVDPP